MSPYIYQLLMKGEIKLPVLLEDVEGRGTEVPAVHTLFQPLRQSVYAVLFNLNHQKFGRKQVRPYGNSINFLQVGVGIIYMVSET